MLLSESKPPMDQGQWKPEEFHRMTTRHELTVSVRMDSETNP
jgi:hypothetical protein